MEFLVEPTNMFGILGMLDGACVKLNCCGVTCDDLTCSTYHDKKNLAEL